MAVDVGELLDLPGADLVSKGLDDLARGAETEEAALVSYAAPQLRSLGIAIPAPLDDAKERLWRLLEARVGEDAAHGRFNALERRIVSFEHALACAGR